MKSVDNSHDGNRIRDGGCRRADENRIRVRDFHYRRANQNHICDRDYDRHDSEVEPFNPGW